MIVPCEHDPPSRDIRIIVHSPWPLFEDPRLGHTLRGNVCESAAPKGATARPLPAWDARPVARSESEFGRPTAGPMRGSGSLPGVLARLPRFSVWGVWRGDSSSYATSGLRAFPDARPLRDCQQTRHGWRPGGCPWRGMARREIPAATNASPSNRFRAGRSDSETTPLEPGGNSLR